MTKSWARRDSKTPENLLVKLATLEEYKKKKCNNLDAEKASDH